jgi:two-component sensor histidine kinase
MSNVPSDTFRSHSNTPDDLKRLIEGRINALAKVHTLFVESRWTGAQLHSLVTQELLPRRERGACPNYRPNRNAGAEFGSGDCDLVA